MFSRLGGYQVVLQKSDTNYVIRAKQSTNCAPPYDKIDLATCLHGSRANHFAASSTLIALAAVFAMFAFF